MCGGDNQAQLLKVLGKTHVVKLELTYQMKYRLIKELGMISYDGNRCLSVARRAASLQPWHVE